MVAIFKQNKELKKRIIPMPVSEKQTIHMVIIGSVDHGKSTLIGRLLNDTGTLPDGKVKAIKKMCDRRGIGFEWAFVMDAFQAERDQAVTIDSAHIWFNTEQRSYVIVDAPGHEEFIKNMVSGAADCSAALLIVDACEGVCEQTRRHAYLMTLLGIKEIIVVINKMDSINFDEVKYSSVQADICNYLAKLNLIAGYIIPVSARDGDNIVNQSIKSDWYAGPTVTEALDKLAFPISQSERPLRMPIQDVYHFDDHRIIAGYIESGVLAVGDELLFSPSNRLARVVSILNWPYKNGAVSAEAGQSMGIIIDEDIFVERGEVISHSINPPLESNVFRAHIFWLGVRPLSIGAQYKLRIATLEVLIEVQSIDTIIDINDPSRSQDSPNKSFIKRNEIGQAVLRSASMLALDEFATNQNMGRFVLLDGDDIAGGGIISMEGYPDQRSLITDKSTNIFSVDYGVASDSRLQRNGHKGGVIWFTGLSGSGKTTIAVEIEKKLFKKGYQVYVLDGDNIRGGLNSNLGFSPEDRAENIRRVGEVAALFADAGFIVLAAFISPYRADRIRARSAVGRYASSSFHEVYVKASLEVCEERDPKGLYERARSGDILEFTGISAPYEEPSDQELIIDTGGKPIEECVSQLMSYIENSFSRT